MTNLLLQGLSLESFYSDMKSIIANEVKDAVTNAMPVADDTPEFLSRKETARMLGISLPTLHTLTTKGLIRSYRIGEHTIRYKKDDVINAVRPKA